MKLQRPLSLSARILKAEELVESLASALASRGEFASKSTMEMCDLTLENVTDHSKQADRHGALLQEHLRSRVLLKFDCSFMLY
jgi:hypothetical protein